MKQYIKIIDGTSVIKSRNQIVIRGTKTVKTSNGEDKEVTTQIINPAEETLFADGWSEYITPEPTAEELLQAARQRKVREIERYDSSSEVNQFFVSEIPVWLDKATRAGLLLRFQAEKAQGLVSTALWYNGVQFPLSVDNAIAMLYAIELYASACYDNTQRHLAAVNALTTIEEIEQYDYRSGYPDKLNF